MGSQEPRTTHLHWHFDIFGGHNFFPRLPRHCIPPSMLPYQIKRLLSFSDIAPPLPNLLTDWDWVRAGDSCHPLHLSSCSLPYSASWWFSLKLLSWRNYHAGDLLRDGLFYAVIITVSHTNQISMDFTLWNVMSAWTQSRIKPQNIA